MRFIVPGRPFGKARPRKGKFGVYNPKVNKDYEESIRKAYRAATGIIAEPVDKPIWLCVECIYPIPKATPKKKRELMLNEKIFPLVRPDIDNCLKSVMDALNGLAYLDDKQVALVHMKKRYGENAMTIIDIGRYYK